MSDDRQIIEALIQVSMTFSALASAIVPLVTATGAREAVSRFETAKAEMEKFNGMLQRMTAEIAQG